MNGKVETKEYRFDLLKWLVVIALVLGGAVAYYVFSEQYVALIRVSGMLLVLVAAGFLAVNTAAGNSFWQLLRAAQVEVRKVVWPTRQETTQTTMLVMAVVLVTALILWGLDSLLGYFARLVIA